MPSTKKTATKARKVTSASLLADASDPGKPRLTESGRKLISDIENQWQLTPASRALLELAAHSVSIAERASAIIEVEGTTYLDRFSAPRLRPEVSVLEKANAAAAGALAKLLPTLEN